MERAKRKMFLIDRNILNILKERYSGQTLSKMRSLYSALCEIIDESENGETISLEIISKAAGLNMEFIRNNLDVFRELNIIDIEK